jgi:hypothetical protein
MSACRLRRVGARHLVALVPNASAIKLGMLVPVVTGVNPIRVNRIAVLFCEMTANAVIVQGFSDTVTSPLPPG